MSKGKFNMMEYISDFYYNHGNNMTISEWFFYIDVRALCGDNAPESVVSKACNEVYSKVRCK